MMKMRSALFTFVATISVFCLQSVGSSTSASEKPLLHALLIGNSDYGAAQLRNPAKDATLLSKTLQSLGFQVTLKTDLTHEAMDEAINDFSRSVPEGALALFYFAGHGVQVESQNFLIPVDARLREATTVKYKTVSQDYVLDSLHASDGNMKVVILDCCRDNPFQRAWTRSSVRSGLAVPSAIPKGTIIAYATAPGETALDGKGDNSPYATHLAAALRTRPPQGLTIRQVFFSASEAVARETDQHPWMNLDASVPSVYLRPPSEQFKKAAAMAADHTLDLSSGQDRVSPQSAVLTPVASKPVASKPAAVKLAALKPAALKPAALKPPVSFQSPPRITTKKDAAPADESLLTQARIFHQETKYPLAIDAYTAIINNASMRPETRRQARQGRARALVSRREGNDLLLAITDTKALGVEGIYLSVLADVADLKVDALSTGKVRKAQTVLVTQAREDWLWVKSVQGDQSISGWVKNVAFEPSVDLPKPAPKIATTAPLSTKSHAQPVQRLPSRPHNYGTQQQSSSSSYGRSNFGNSNSGYSSSSSNWGQTHTNQNLRVPKQNGTLFYSVPKNSGSTRPQSTGWSNQSSNGRWSKQIWQRPGSHLNSRPSGNMVPRNADPWTKNYMRKNGRAPSIWETPRWEGLREIQQKRRQGLLR